MCAEADSKQILVPKLYLADNFWKRFWGLMLRKSLASDEGLLLTPCNGVHTFFMRFPIDVIYLNEHMKILAVFRAKPWRILPVIKGTKHVLEVSSESGLLKRIKVGQRVNIEKY